jgi:uncharacterized protein (TIGR00369 family)
MKELKPISPTCFACGPGNEHGLKMRFTRDDERVRSELAIPAHLRGWGNIAHGGIVSTILDEVMAWAALHLMRKFILTKQMKVTFAKPVLIETRLVAEARVIQPKDERCVIMGGEITDKSGTIYARGQGEYALFERDDFEKLGIVPQELIDAFAQVLGFDARKL